jgi:hypothetical protein
MGGGLMQLVAYGAQDIYLTGNPQITFFKVVYRRHTNFSMESIEQTFNGTAAFDSAVDCTIARNGDLIHKMYIEYSPSAVLTTSGGGAKNVHANVGHTLLKEMELEIGGQRIDKHYSHWLTTWNELTDKNPTGSKLTLNVGGSAGTGDLEKAQSVTGLLTNTSEEATQYQLTSFNHKGVSSCTIDNRAKKNKAFVPLQFWFCRNVGLALPLIALQYHEVKVKITFCEQAKVSSGTGSLSDVKLWTDYIYLDTDERRRFAQVSHEYLIEQLQTTSFLGAVGNRDINLNHPVKELIWIGKEVDTATVTAGPGTPVLLTSNAATTFKLKLNGHDRIAARSFKYFTQTQVNQHHSGFGGTTIADSIGVYSFALKPEEHQPSGTCNFSRIDNAQFVIGGATAATNLRIYAVNYNVLRIMSGMGGLAYSN